MDVATETDDEQRAVEALLGGRVRVHQLRECERCSVGLGVQRVQSFFTWNSSPWPEMSVIAFAHLVASAEYLRNTASSVRSSG